MLCIFSKKWRASRHNIVETRAPNKCFRKRHQLDSGEVRQIAILVGSIDRTRSQQLSKGSLGKRDRGRSFTSFVNKFSNSRMHLLFEKKLCGTRFRLIVLDATITTTRQPIQRFKAAQHVALSTMLTTQTLAQWSTGNVKDTRQVQRWNLKDSVEERNPILLLRRPLKASAARVGRFVSTGQFIA